MKQIVATITTPMSTKYLHYPSSYPSSPWQCAIRRNPGSLEEAGVTQLSLSLLPPSFFPPDWLRTKNPRTRLRQRQSAFWKPDAPYNFLLYNFFWPSVLMLYFHCFTYHFLCNILLRPTGEKASCVFVTQKHRLLIKMFRGVSPFWVRYKFSFPIFRNSSSSRWGLCIRYIICFHL